VPSLDHTSGGSIEADIGVCPLDSSESWSRRQRKCQEGDYRLVRCDVNGSTAHYLAAISLSYPPILTWMSMHGVSRRCSRLAYCPCRSITLFTLLPLLALYCIPRTCRSSSSDHQAGHRFQNHPKALTPGQPQTLVSHLFSGPTKLDEIHHTALPLGVPTKNTISNRNDRMIGVR